MFLKALYDPQTPLCSPKPSKKCQGMGTPEEQPPWRWCVTTQISHPTVSWGQQTRALTAAKLPSRIKLQSQGRWPCNPSLAVSLPCLHSLSIRNQEAFFFEHFKKQQQQQKKNLVLFPFPFFLVVLGLGCDLEDLCCILWRLSLCRTGFSSCSMPAL